MTTNTELKTLYPIAAVLTYGDQRFLFDVSDAILVGDLSSDNTAANNFIMMDLGDPFVFEKLVDYLKTHKPPPTQWPRA